MAVPWLLAQNLEHNTLNLPSARCYTSGIPDTPTAERFLVDLGSTGWSGFVAARMDSQYMTAACTLPQSTAEVSGIWSYLVFSNPQRNFENWVDRARPILASSAQGFGQSNHLRMLAAVLGPSGLSPLMLVLGCTGHCKNPLLHDSPRPGCKPAWTTALSSNSLPHA